MLNYLPIITGIFVAVSGLMVLKLGDWRKLAWKYAGVTISTGISLAMLLTVLLDSKLTHFGDCALCFAAKDVAFLIFHISVGRDAIRLRGRERRAA